MGGIRHTTGNPDRPPTRAGISLGDALAAMFGVIGALAALTEARRSGRGQEVDVAIYEAVAALMESSMADLELGGVLRGRSGSTLPGVAPSNVYPTADGSEVIIAGNADSVFARLCVAMGEPELATDERYATHGGRGANMEELDQHIAKWTGSLPTAELLALLDRTWRAGRAHLHGARHAHRPAVPGPRDGAAVAVVTRMGRAHGRHRAEVHGDTGRGAQRRTDARAAHRRRSCGTWPA